MGIPSGQGQPRSKTTSGVGGARGVVELSARTAAATFRFAPARVAEVGDGWVLAEGWASAGAGAGEEREKDYWVHAWRVRGGFREYFNASVTVRELGCRARPTADEQGGVVWAVWESQFPCWAKAQRCMPGLVLAI